MAKKNITTLEGLAEMLQRTMASKEDMGIFAQPPKKVYFGNTSLHNYLMSQYLRDDLRIL